MSENVLERSEIQERALYAVFVLQGNKFLW